MTRDQVEARFREAAVAPDPDELDRFAERATALRALVESFATLAARDRQEEDDA